MGPVVTIPTREGQICKTLITLEDEDPEAIYIIAEDPAPYDMDDNIYVVNLKDLQRNIKEPSLTPQIAIVKNELNVVAADLEEYIRSWNV